MDPRQARRASRTEDRSRPHEHGRCPAHGPATEQSRRVRRPELPSATSFYGGGGSACTTARGGAYTTGAGAATTAPGRPKIPIPPRIWLNTAKAPRPSAASVDDPGERGAREQHRNRHGQTTHQLLHGATPLSAIPRRPLHGSVGRPGGRPGIQGRGRAFRGSRRPGKPARRLCGTVPAIRSTGRQTWRL